MTEEEISDLTKLLNEHYTGISIALAKVESATETHERRISELERVMIAATANIAEARGALHMLLVLIPVAIAFTGMIVTLIVKFL